MENKSDKFLLNVHQQTTRNPENEIFFLTGDLNIDGIQNKNKSSSKFNQEPEIEMTDFINYYKNNGELKMKRPCVNTWLENPSRYTLMMALLNSGKLIVDDLQLEVLNKHLVTYGESEHNRETDEFKSKEFALTDKIDQMSEQGLDYIMVANYYDSQNDPESQGYKRGSSFIKQNTTNIQISKLKKQEFYVKDKKYSQLSDHLGIELNLLLKNNKD